jgi:hypothetical protein
VAENWAKKSYVGYDAPFSDETRWTVEGFAARFASLADHFRECARTSDERSSTRFYEGYAAALDQVAIDLKSPYEQRVSRIDGREAGKE